MEKPDKRKNQITQQIRTILNSNLLERCVVDTGSPCIAVNAKVQTNNRRERESEGRVEAHREVELTLLFVAKASRIYTGARTDCSRS
jgi:hypothetical protein